LAWLVGNDTTQAEAGIIEKWDGTRWSVFPGPQFQTGDQTHLFAMTSTSATDIWAVGTLVDDIGAGFSLFEHFDGSKWTATTVENAAGLQFLDGVSADATTDAWAVGFVEVDVARTFSMHWDGTNWSSVPIPNVGSGTNRLYGVLALAPNNVWAVGLSTPAVQNFATLTLIEHFDGTSWTVVPSPNVGPNSANQNNALFGITGDSANDLWAFGSYFAADGSQQQMTLLMHWNGTVWKIVRSPNPTGGNFLSDALLAGVTPSPGNVWILGSENVAPRTNSLAIHTTSGSAPIF
jgi:hypothetical protein